MLRPINEIDSYGYSIEMDISIDGKPDRIEVDSNFIHEVTIIRDYMGAFTSLIRISFALGKEEFLSIEKELDDMVFHLNIRNFKIQDDPEDAVKSNKTMRNDYLRGDFRGLLESDIDPTLLATIRPLDTGDTGINKFLDGATQGMDINPVTVYLFDPEHVVKYNTPLPINLDKSHNKLDFIYYAIAKRGFKKLLMTPPDNMRIGDIAIGETKLGDTLDMIDRQFGIYQNAPYIFFIENKTAFLVDPSRLGSVAIKGENPKITMYLESPNEREGLLGGCYYDEGLQFIALPTPPDVVNVDAIDYMDAEDTRYLIMGEYKKDNDKGNKDPKDKMKKSIVVYGPHAIKHDRFRKMISEKKITMSIEAIDDSIITVEKVYSMIAHRTYDALDINGEYLLVSKITTLNKDMNRFMGNTILDMRKIEKA